MKLLYHDYKYYPYERQLALREAAALLGSCEVRELTNGVEIGGRPSPDNANRLVYFSQIHNGRVTRDTIQARLERAVTAGKKRQATRYSVHGLHEYKGKFNPQIAKAILNIFGVSADNHVLDPFCGSGTTLVECAHMGARATGVDLNPLAAFIANAKLLALKTPSTDILNCLHKLEKCFARIQKWSVEMPQDNRGIYLRKWFDKKNLSCIEIVKDQIIMHAGAMAPIFLCIASNLLRDYSLQDPNDLRIRRRTSPLPSVPLAAAYIETCRNFCSHLAETQSVLGTELPLGRAHVLSIAELAKVHPRNRFDAALTSPPYAMALPYIDTQRLSLIWLGLVQASEILPLEAELIGSREMRGNARRELSVRLHDNVDRLPAEQLNFCRDLQQRLGAEDGFRRKAVPALLYRYFARMQETFHLLRQQLKSGAPFALIVGHNHTVLGGVRQDIDTPSHLASLAANMGWRLEEFVQLQTYQRYGYHMDNAVSAESLIVLRNP